MAPSSSPAAKLLAAAPSSGSKISVRCRGCNQEFPSRNAVFKHLKETDAICLFDEGSAASNIETKAQTNNTGEAIDAHVEKQREEYEEFVRFVHKSTPPGKVAILYGYLPFMSLENEKNTNNNLTIHNGQDAARILLYAIDVVQAEINCDPTPSINDTKYSDHRTQRSYGYYTRKADCARQDDDTSCITEVMAIRLPALRRGMTVDNWLKLVQDVMEGMFAVVTSAPSSTMMASLYPCAPIRVLGRQDVPAKFDAESDVTQRRVEYLLPIEFLTWSLTKNDNEVDLKKKLETEMPVFCENHRHSLLPGQSPGENIPSIDPTLVNKQPEELIRLYLLDLKSKMRLLTTKVIDLDILDMESVQNKEFNIKRRSQDKKKRSRKELKTSEEGVPKSDHTKCEIETPDGNNVSDDNRNKKDEISTVTTDSAECKKRTRRVLKRRRYHNFTDRLLAHDFLAYRRLDRFYHRSTMRLPQTTFSQLNPSKEKSTYVILSMSGDLILNGQASRLVGLLLAFANGIIDPGFSDVVFDEDYLHLVPTPPAPPIGFISAEAQYANAEGKGKCILSARICDRYDKGWNQASTIQRVKEWQSVVYDYVANEWRTHIRDPSNRLSVERKWTETVLLPWAETAKHHLNEYERMKAGRSINKVLKTTLNSDNDVPEAYKDVLFHLRQIDSSGKWPTTTPKRQMVMVSNSIASTNDEGVETLVKSDSLSVAFVKAKNNQHETRSSAYSFKEGWGGASGSFSVGYMPGGINKRPKSNELFPEFVKAAFKLETVLFPDRKPSSTIAVNRNAQFRPHTDSGAGAGQSTSLIVALGNFIGGELVVEGETVCIQYQPIEFDGWKQRHWTMPFEGERYSLVWFTPKGCEGLRGIDLDF